MKHVHVRGEGNLLLFTDLAYTSHCLIVAAFECRQACVMAARLTARGGRCISFDLSPRGKPACPEVRREPVKRTFQPHRKSRKRTHGFRKRMKTAAGREVIRRRRRKGRRQLTVTIAKK